MKKTLTALSLVALLPAVAVLADDDKCSAPPGQWQPREAALQLARDNGWTVRQFDIDDGCYEIEGRDSDGREIEVKLEPETLRIIEMEHEGDDEGGRGRNSAPAGVVVPPPNGLFGNGTPPQVQVN